MASAEESFMTRTGAYTADVDAGGLGDEGFRPSANASAHAAQLIGGGTDYCVQATSDSGTIYKLNSSAGAGVQRGLTRKSNRRLSRGKLQGRPFGGAYSLLFGKSPLTAIHGTRRELPSVSHSTA